MCLACPSYREVRDHIALCMYGPVSCIVFYTAQVASGVPLGSVLLYSVHIAVSPSIYWALRVLGHYCSLFMMLRVNQPMILWFHWIDSSKFDKFWSAEYIQSAYNIHLLFHADGGTEHDT